MPTLLRRTLEFAHEEKQEGRGGEGRCERFFCVIVLYRRLRCRYRLVG